MMKDEQKQIVWIKLYLAVVKCCEEDCSAHCDAFAVERRNHLGSVTRIYNTSGTAVFSAYYDPWGVQTVTTNTIGYRSALWDAFIMEWRKNYVQQPTSAQSFNRDSYCLNNPLKYTDPSGEFWTSKHMTHWFEISANRKAAKYFSGRGVVWDYKKYPLNISKILSYFQYDNNYNRINIKYL